MEQQKVTNVVLLLVTSQFVRDHVRVTDYQDNDFSVFFAIENYWSEGLLNNAWKDPEAACLPRKIHKTIFSIVLVIKLSLWLKYSTVNPLPK
jgi:hypothetical protein